MYCTNCGEMLADLDRFCAACGTSRSGVIQVPRELGETPPKISVLRKIHSIYEAVGPAHSLVWLVFSVVALWAHGWVALIFWALGYLLLSTFRNPMVKALGLIATAAVCVLVGGVVSDYARELWAGLTGA